MTPAPRRKTKISELPDLPVRICYVPWLIPTWAKAQAWWTVILIKRGVGLTEGLLAHELAHVLQWRALGVFGFVFHYVRSFLRHGYDTHPLEMTAHLAAQDDYFLNWARDILKSRKRT